MKVYRGTRESGDCVVTVNGTPLDPRLDLRILSTEGFEWGYDGGGPSQLALAILADHFGDDGKAVNHYRFFRGAVIAMIRDDEWTIDTTRVDSSFTSSVEVPMTLDELLDKVRKAGLKQEPSR